MSHLPEYTSLSSSIQESKHIPHMSSSPPPPLHTSIANTSIPSPSPPLHSHTSTSTHSSSHRGHHGYSVDPDGDYSLIPASSLNLSSSSSAITVSPPHPSKQQQQQQNNNQHNDHGIVEPRNNNSNNRNIQRYHPVDIQRQRFPFSLVWGPLPCITWLFPCIGHLGIADSRGYIHDFQSSYYIRRNRFMTGNVYKYYQFNIEDLESTLGPGYAIEWDNALNHGDECFGEREHQLCVNNCHHHVEDCLARIHIKKNIVQLALLMITHGKYTSISSCIGIYIPFIIFISIIFALIFFPIFF